MDVIIGSYDGVISGYRLVRTASESRDVKFKQSFADTSHKGCIKYLAASRKGLVASGSTDETIHLFDLHRRTDVGSLVSHEGDINCLKFIGKDFLYSSSSDGTIRLWRTRIWELQRTFKGHKGSVVAFDIHPSKKLALSIGSDKKLIVWDLVAGKYSFIRNMKKLCDNVKFNPSGTVYIITVGQLIEFYDLETAEVTRTQDLGSRVNGSPTFITDDLLAVGTDSGNVAFVSRSGKGIEAQFQAHETRIRGVEAVKSSVPHTVFLITCSSDQTIRAWDLDLRTMKEQMIASVNTGCRITCVTVIPPSSAFDLLLDPEANVVSQDSLQASKESTEVKKVPPVKRKTGLKLSAANSVTHSPVSNTCRTSDGRKKKSNKRLHKGSIRPSKSAVPDSDRTLDQSLTT